MDSVPFVYGPGWQVTPLGADPSEPSDPWREPAGRFAFDYSGETLALQLAVGNYWGYLYVLVDGAPANRLPAIAGNHNSQNQIAGYKPLLAPERQTADGPATQWVVVHRAADPGPHHVEVEIWRSWGQVPVRAVAVDALPAPPLPLWPAVAAAALAGWGAIPVAAMAVRQRFADLTWHRPGLPLPQPAQGWLPFVAIPLLLIGGGIVRDNWLLTDLGLGALALAGLARPTLWTGALLFGLPFYLHPLPILPGRALNLVEIGIWGGLVVLAGHWWVVRPGQQEERRAQARGQFLSFANPHILLAAIITLALIAAFAAEQRSVALREWRTLFLAAGGFALLLSGTLALDRQAGARQTLVTCWLAGGALIALVGLGQYASGRMLIEAEGVNRVRAFYGSPNNLALYLERTVAVALALALFAPDGGRGQALFRSGALWWMLAIPQLAALLLTFSKGAIFLALPAIFLSLGAGGYLLLRRRNASLRPLWGLAAVALGMAAGLLPFVGAERFQALGDFSPQSTGGLRLNLWRSSWRMALDYPVLGVGPDNFLYVYRSGYILPAAWQDPDLNHPHNVVLDWWTRLGVGGLALAVGWMTAGLRHFGRNQGSALSLGCLAALAAGLAHGLIDASYALPDLMLVWVFLLGHFGAKGSRECDL